MSSAHPPPSTHPSYLPCVTSFTLSRVNVADPDPGSGAFLTPGSKIRNRFVLDPGFPNSFLGPKKIAPEMLTTP